jgi:hypothetical protein
MAGSQFRSSEAGSSQAGSQRTRQPAAGRSSSDARPAAARPAATSTRQWVIRIVGALAIIGGLTITLIGATPGILGGWGTIGLMVPGMLIATGGFVAIIETTPLARSRRR